MSFVAEHVIALCRWHPSDDSAAAVEQRPPGTGVRCESMCMRCSSQQCIGLQFEPIQTEKQMNEAIMQGCIRHTG